MTAIKERGKISSSIMCADFLRLDECLRELEKNNIEYIHYDIMDGHFVSNFTLGTDFVEKVSGATTIPSDLHLMIMDPELKLRWFRFKNPDFVSIHYESTRHIQRALQMVRDMGGRPMIAINPGTPLCALDYVTDIIDGVLIMTVNPGFAGQKLVQATLGKISDVRRMLDENGREDAVIEVDGNVSLQNAKAMRKAGADIFVAGTSSVFAKGQSITDNVKKLREAIR